MDLRAVLSRLRALLSRGREGRPQPPADRKMRRPGRDYEDKMLRWREDKGQGVPRL